MFDCRVLLEPNDRDYNIRTHDDICLRVSRHYSKHVKCGFWGCNRTSHPTEANKQYVIYYSHRNNRTWHLLYACADCFASYMLHSIGGEDRWGETAPFVYPKRWRRSRRDKIVDALRHVWAKRR